MRTDHSVQVARMRAIARTHPEGSLERMSAETAADLLELHDDTGISLDNWVAARDLVEHFLGEPITENHV